MLLFLGQPVNSTKYPEVTTPLNELETMSANYLSVNTHDYRDADVYLMLYDLNLGFNKDKPNGLVHLYKGSKYFQPEISGNLSGIYYIPLSQLGVRFIRGHTYQINFATREEIHGGGGFRDDVYVYEFLGNTTKYTISLNVSDGVMNNYDDSYKDSQQQQQTDAIKDQTEQDKQFYDDLLSDQYDENVIGDTIGGVSSSTDDVDYSQYSGLFSTIFGKFSSAISGDYSSVDNISIPIPFTQGNLNITSDILYNIIKGSFIYTFLQIVWYFIFGMYIFKFSNNLVRSIKSGKILNGFENNDEVITSTML